jgi:tetratricopeptide (TPR) repeat protein
MLAQRECPDPNGLTGKEGVVHKQRASGYFRQGMQFLHADRPDEALKYFTRAIELDPRFAEAYRNRGEAYILLGRVVEANNDLRKAKLFGTGNSSEKATRKVEKIDLKSVHSIYDDLLADGSPDRDAVNFDGRAYDYVFSDDALESDELLASLAAGQAGQAEFPAILEYLDGRREEVPVIRLFGPGPDENTLAFRRNGGEDNVSLDQLSCVRLARVPADFAQYDAANCQVEVIETIDGNIYHEYIHPEQGLKNVLYGFSTKQDSRFKYTLIPRTSIRKRFQRRHLGQILLDRKLLSGEVLKQALDSYTEQKKAKFGEIIAQHAKILYSAVEFEIQRAYQANERGLKVGEILLKAGLVSEEQIQGALAQQERLKNKKLGQFLIEKGILQEKEVYMALAEKFRIPFVNLRQQKITRTILNLLPREVIRKLLVLPLAVREDTLVVATLMPDPGPVCEVVHRYAAARNVEFVLVQPSHLKNVIRVLFQEKG